MDALLQEHVSLLREQARLEAKAYKRLLSDPRAWVVRREAVGSVQKFAMDGVRKHLRGKNRRYQEVCARLEIVMLQMRANVGSRMGESNVQSTINQS